MSATLPVHATRMLPTRHLGRRLLVFPRLDSTNTLALALATDPTQHGVALLADEQTAGRGQYGRAWQAPPRSSVLLSVLLFPPAELRRPVLLVAWAAVAVCALVEEATGLTPVLKWPNDVLLGGKKVCGILTEQRNSGAAELPLATVVGIGLNVTQPAELFAAAELPYAGSLYSLSGRPLDTHEVAVRLIGHLDDGYGRLFDGDFLTLQRAWQERLGLIGRAVHVEGVGAEWHGWLRELTLDGLQLELPHGRVVRLAPEAVRHVAPS